MIFNVELLDYVGSIDAMLIDEAYDGLKKRKQYAQSRNVCLLVAVVFALILLPVCKYCFSRVALESQEDSGCNTLPGASEIYPTIQVDGEFYQWRMGRAVMNFDAYAQTTYDPELFLKDMNYYGEIIKGNEDSPKQDRELACVFDASGSIYLDPDDEEVVYLWLTTDWFEDGVIAFDRVETK